MKKIISLFLIIILISTVSASVYSADPYWALHSEYTDAVDKNDENGIISATKKVEALYPKYKSLDECNRTIWKIQKVAGIYEKREDFENAALYYQKFIDGANYLINHGGDSFSKADVKLYEQLVKYLSVKPKVFAETSNPDNIPYYGALNENRVGLNQGMCSAFSEGVDSAYLLYVSFFKENISSFAWRLPEGNDYYLEIAWNLPNENLDDLKKVASGESDDYIIENLRFLSELDCKVLLRFGAEVNCWADLPQTQDEVNARGKTYTDTFKKAFRKVSSLARQYAPGAAMVFSPNDVSGYYLPFEEFYPGDEYVDWVGMSTYNNNYDSYPKTRGKTSDALYSKGYFDNQIEKISDIVNEYGDRKPIMISECGFAYANTAGTLNMQGAIKRMNFFYSYVNRVYPQVKSVFYFNHSTSNKYRLFGDILESVDETDQSRAYRSLLASNAAAQYTLGKSDTVGYTDIANIKNEDLKKLSLSVYAFYPSDKTTSVEYYLDGKSVKKTTSVPYDYSLDLSAYREGVHSLMIKVVCGSNEDISCYKVFKDTNNLTSVYKINKKICNEIAEKTWKLGFEDFPKQSSWMYEPLTYCVLNGIISGVSNTSVDPSAKVTRGQFITILYRVCGSPEVFGVASPFKDLKQDWYKDAVMWAYSNNITSGTSDTTFSPNNNITREEIATFLARYDRYFCGKDASFESALMACDSYNEYFDMLGYDDLTFDSIDMLKEISQREGFSLTELTETNPEGLKSISSDNWMGINSGDVLIIETDAATTDGTCLEIGFVIEVNDGNARLRTAEGREHTVEKEYIYGNVYDLKLVYNPKYIESFSDRNKVSKWAVEGMNECVKSGLITGVENAGSVTLSPKDKSTRAQIATVAYRLLTRGE